MKRFIMTVMPTIKKMSDVFLLVVLLLSLTACGKSTEAKWQEQYDLGMQYLEEGDYSAAVVAFTKAIFTEPNAAALYIARGDAYSAWAEEALSGAMDALADGDMVAWSDITVTADGSTYTLDDLYDRAIGDYEEAIRLVESDEADDDSPEEISEEADEKRQQTEEKREEGREEYIKKLDELSPSDTDADNETGDLGEDDNLEAYQNYEDCSEEEQSVIAMLVSAAETGDLDSLPQLTEIPEVTGDFYYNGYKVQITRGYDYGENCTLEGTDREGYWWPYMIVSVRPESGMGYAYFIWEDLEGLSAWLIGVGYFRATDYIACPCDGWDWNGEYTESYLLDTKDIYTHTGYETGTVTDNLLNGTISGTYTTYFDTASWTAVYENGIYISGARNNGDWQDNYVSSNDYKTIVAKYFWLDEAAEN